jgi:hypothetical protein
LTCERRIKSLAVRVLALDQVRLPVALSLLERCHALNGNVDVVMDIVPNEKEDLVFSSKLARVAAPLLSVSALQIVRHADVKRAVFPACQHLDEVHMVAHAPHPP